MVSVKYYKLLFIIEKIKELIIKMLLINIPKIKLTYQ